MGGDNSIRMLKRPSVIQSFTKGDDRGDSSYRFTLLVGDCSSKKIYRVFIGDDGGGGDGDGDSGGGNGNGNNQNYKGSYTGLSNSYILIEFPEGCQENEYFVVDQTEGAVSQFDFFVGITRSLAGYISIIPEILEEDRDLGLVVVQDLGDTSLYQFSQGRGPIERQFYEVLILWIVLLQDFPHKAHPLVHQRVFEKKAMHLELDDFIIWGLCKDIAKDDLKMISDYFEEIVVEIDQYQYRVVHRDFQSKNIMISDNTPYVIDTQDMCMGPPLYDLASLLYDANMMLPQIERIYLAFLYCNRISKKHELMKDFCNLLQITGLQRVLKNLGRHSKYYYQMGRKESLKNISNNLKMLRELRQEIPDLEDLFVILDKYMKKGDEEAVGDSETIPSDSG